MRFFVSWRKSSRVKSISWLISASWSSASSSLTYFLRETTKRFILAIASASMLLISSRSSRVSASFICLIIFFATSLFDLIDARGVFISCATPATSWPSDAIFSEFISCSCVSFNSFNAFFKSSTICSFFL